MDRRLHKILYILIGLSALFAIAYFGIEYLGETRVDPVVDKYKKVQSEYLVSFKEDQEFLSKVSLFDLNPQPSKDASSYLNPRFPWMPKPSGREEFASHIPTELAEQLMRFKGDWMRHHTQLLRSKELDLSIFTEVKNFDYWNVEANGPIADLIKNQEYVPPELLPIPDPVEILNLTKARLAAGADQKQALLSLQQVRKLAELLLTTENINLYTTGLAVLDLERIAYQYFTDSQMLRESDWEPISRNVTRRAARALWGARGYFYVFTDTQIMHQVFISTRLPVGFCAAVNEAALKELSLRDMLGHQWPLERNYNQQWVMIDKVMERATQNCRLTYLRKMIEGSLLKRSYSVPGFLTALPYSRKIFGMRIATLPFIGFESYSDPKQHD